MNIFETPIDKDDWITNGRTANGLSNGDFTHNSFRLHQRKHAKGQYDFTNHIKHRILQKEL